MAGKNLEIHGLKEDPDRWEHLIEQEIADSATNETARAVVESMYWEKDRGAAFARYAASLDFSHVRDLLHVFGVRESQDICEVGGGAGQVAWALAEGGFENVELLEPNGRWITGTGFLQTQLDALGGRLRICNSLDDWYASERSYRHIITRNCVHHFPNIAMAATAIRQKLRKRGLWVMIREWYADDAREVLQQIRNHPYCQKYQVYEFPFPAGHYVDCLRLGGFKLKAVVPARYANDALGAYVNDEGSSLVRLFSKMTRWLIRKLPRLTVLLFRVENALNSLPLVRLRLFSRPQVMVFERLDV